MFLEPNSCYAKEVFIIHICLPPFRIPDVISLFEPDASFSSAGCVITKTKFLSLPKKTFCLIFPLN